MKRHQQVLLGVLVLQMVLSGVVFWPRKAVTSSGELLFPDLKVEDVVRLKLTDNAGEQVAMRKVAGSWVLPEAGDYPVNESAVTALLNKLVLLNNATLVARTQASHAPLQVSADAFQRRVELETADGATQTVYLGSAPRYTATHFRVDGQSETYLTTGLAAYDVNVRFNSWVDTAYAHIDQATITRVVLENAQGRFELVRDEETWTLADLAEDETVMVGSTGAVVRNVATLSLLRPLGKTEETAYGLEEPTAVVTVYTDDGSTHVLTVGAQNASDNSYVVKSSESPYYVQVAEFSLTAMVENDRADFLEEPAVDPELEPVTP